MTPLDAATVGSIPTVMHTTIHCGMPLNSLDLDLTTLPKLKAERNSSGAADQYTLQAITI